MYHTVPISTMGKGAINSKGKLSGVAKHNLRKYHSKEYDRENIVLLFGSTNLLRDVKKYTGTL